MIRHTWLIPIIFSAVASLVLTSCDETGDGRVGILPVRLDGSDRWSLIDTHGDIVVENRWDSRPAMTVNGFFSAADSSGITVYTVTHDDITPLATSLVAAGTMTEGRMPVCRPGQRIELIDANGQSMATLMPVDSAEIDAVRPFFTSGRMIFRTRSGGSDAVYRYGAIDIDGRVAVQPRFSSLFPYHNGIALAAESDSAFRHMLVDTDGHVIFTFPEGMLPLADGVYREIMPVSVDGQPAFINTCGVMRRLPESVKEIVDFTDHIFVYADPDGRMGLMTTEGRHILRPRYREIAILDNDHFLTTGNDGECALINRSAHTLLSFPDVDRLFSLRHMFPFSSRFKIIGHTPDNTYIIYDDNGSAVGTYDITDFSTAIIIDPIATDCGDMIRSDYFDINRAAEAFTSPLRSDGYGRAAIGQPISGLLTGTPEENASTRTAVFRSSSTNFYTLRATAASAVTAASLEAVYNESRSWFFNIPLRKFEGFEYRFNPEAVINRINVTLTTENRTFTLTRNAIEKLIAAAGFSVAEQTEAYTMLRSPHSITFLFPAPGALGSEMTLLPLDASAENLNAIRREAEINFTTQ